MLPFTNDRAVLVGEIPYITDPYGNKIPDPNGATRETVGCVIHDANSLERNNTQTETDYKMFLNPGHNVDSLSLVEWEGKTLTVEGSPAVWKDYHGQPHHVELNLKKVNG
ncbi:hypothetical protein [Nocardiopsis alba]|uniref:hypothetical protein n=1 Tax=Nocardiopsis alba TaxID=53437 RepID=UPI0033A277E0